MKCNTQAPMAAVREALRDLGMKAEGVKMTELRERARRRAMFTPAVFVDGQVMVMGRIAKASKVATWLFDAGGRPAA